MSLIPITFGDHYGDLLSKTFLTLIPWAT